jgi:hypothetical protein
MLALSVRRRNIAIVKKKTASAATMIPAIYMTDSRYIAGKSRRVPDTRRKEEWRIFINIRPSISAAISDMINSTESMANSDRPEAP